MEGTLGVPAHVTASLRPLLGHQPFSFAFAQACRVSARMVIAAAAGTAGYSSYALFLPIQTCRWSDKAGLACGLALDRGGEAALRAEAERRRVGYGHFPVVRQIWEIRGITKTRLIGYDMFGSGSPFVNVFVYVVDQLEYPKPGWKSGKVRLFEVVLGVRL